LKIGKNIEEKDEEIIDAKGMVALPGFVNTHTHSSMTLLRGYADDLKTLIHIHVLETMEKDELSKEDLLSRK